MSLPDSYTLKPNAIPSYFDAMLKAQPPDRFSLKFLQNLGFKSTNDRLFIGVLKDLGFLNRDGAPQPRYFEFLDRSESKRIVADGIRESFSDLFALNVKANEFSPTEVNDKLRSLYAGRKTDGVIGNIASTFKALCAYADFSSTKTSTPPQRSQSEVVSTTENSHEAERHPAAESDHARLPLKSLQYHINIVLPETRDQAVYDAIFNSLRAHLG